MPSARHLQVAYIRRGKRCRRCERIRPSRQARLDETLLRQSARLDSAPFGSVRLSGPRRRGFSLFPSLSLSLSRSSRPSSLPAPAQPGMFVSRLAASGLLLLALMALSLDGKPVQQWSQGRPPGPPIPPLVVQQWSQGRPPRPHIPPLVVQQWSQGLPPRPKIPPLVVQKWDPLPVSPPLLLQPHESPAGGTTALREELSPGPEAASGPAAAGADGGRSGSKAPAAPHRLSKSKGASATSAAAARPMRDLRTDGKQARQNWARMVNPDHHAAVGGGGGGGGGGGARRLKGLAKKGVAKGCFGLKLDRIGTMSGLGC